MVNLSSSTAIIPFSVNGLNTIKRQRLSDGIKKVDLIICCVRNAF